MRLGLQWGRTRAYAQPFAAAGVPGRWAAGSVLGSGAARTCPRSVNRSAIERGEWLVNLVIFQPDEMRAESVTCYGHPVVRMPNYGRLAAEGVLFEQCHVQHTVCSPSRCSMMTGWYPHISGHRTLWHLLRPHEPSLFGYLREAGYHVEWFGKNDLYAPESFPRCVDRFTSFPGGHSGANAHRPGDAGYYAFDYAPFPGRPEETDDMRCVQAGI